MRELNLPQQNLDLRAVVVEASQALALLDADRLEELALACQALNQTRPSEDIPNSSNDQALASQALASQARRASGEPCCHAAPAPAEGREDRVQRGAGAGLGAPGAGLWGQLVQRSAS